MANLRDPLARALALYVVLLPFAFLPPAAAQRPIPSPLPGPTVPGGGGHGSSFEPTSPTQTFVGFNGFRSQTTSGKFRHMEHTHAGGQGRIASPWGEELDFRFWLIEGGFAIEYDRDLVVRYLFDDDGTLAELIAETDELQRRTEIGHRAELVYLGQRELESLDMSAYQLIEERLSANHSDAFLEGLQRFDAPATASCATSSIKCGTCIITWVASVALIVSACLPGGVITMGAACLAAILGHEVASFNCSVTCVDAWYDCGSGGAPDEEDIPEGCDEPGP